MKTYYFISSIFLPVALAGCQAHMEMVDHVSTVEKPTQSESTAKKQTESQGGIIYVDQNVVEEGDGRSWQTAYRSLQAGLNAAGRTGAELWVAQGTYLPAGEKRSTGFTIADGVRVYGSMASGATEKKQDALRTPTVLSGNIGDQNRNDDNCYHVVSAGTNVVLDGVVIEGGFADGVVPNNAGGALRFMKNQNNSELLHVRLNRIIFRDNYAKQGGALFIAEPAKVDISTTYFRTNRALYGGAMMVMEGKINLNDVHFFANYAKFDAGAISLGDGVQADLVSCLFTNNTAEGSGGAMQLRNNPGQNEKTRVTISDTLFSGNRAQGFGGAIDNRNGSIAEITDSHLHDNRAQNGGDIATSGNGSSTVKKCVFIEGRRDCYVEKKRVN